MSQPEPQSSTSQIVGTSIAVVILYIAVLSIPLASGVEMGLSKGELSSWIMALYGVPGALAIFASFRHQQPIPLTGTALAIIFVASIAGRVPYDEIVGAFILSGAIITLLGLLRLNRYLNRLVPTPIVWALLAGMVLPFVINIFSSLGRETLLIGVTFLVFLVSRRLMGPSPIAILPPVVAGVMVAAISGNLQAIPTGGALVTPTLTFPSLSLESALTVVPVIVILVTVQANIPSVVLLRAEGYAPPERTVDLSSGLGTMLGSFFGPVAVSISLPLVPLVSGDDAGERAVRHRVVYLANGGAIVMAMLAGAAAALTGIIPLSLLLALAGIAVLGILAPALQHAVSDGLVIGPVLTFAVVLSDISLLGFGPVFWALVIGIGTSLLLEGDKVRGLNELRAQPTQS